MINYIFESYQQVVENIRQPANQRALITAASRLVLGGNDREFVPIVRNQQQFRVVIRQVNRVKHGTHERIKNQIFLARLVINDQRCMADKASSFQPSQTAEKFFGSRERADIQFSRARLRQDFLDYIKKLEPIVQHCMNSSNGQRLRKNGKNRIRKL